MLQGAGNSHYLQEVVIHLVPIIDFFDVGCVDVAPVVEAFELAGHSDVVVLSTNRRVRSLVA